MITHQELKNEVLKKVIRALEANIHGKVVRDVFNKMMYGPNAPVSDMAVYPDPEEVNDAYVAYGGKRYRRRDSGRVVDSDWDLSVAPIKENIKLISCRMRWEKGLEWEDTPIFKRLSQEIRSGKIPDGLKSELDLRKRYKNLDNIFEETKKIGRLLNMHELPEYYRREHGAPLVHVTRTGICIRSGGGAHRFAIAKILCLPEFPAQLGIIHPYAIYNGTFFKLLKNN